LLAYRDLDDFNEDATHEELETDLIIIAVAGIKDPLRDGIPEAVLTCKGAGVTVRMVTGDILDTAIAISKDAGIIPNDFDQEKNPYVVMQGRDFRNEVGGLIPMEGVGNEGKMQVKDLDKFSEIAKYLKVLARSTPEDKYLLVTGLK